MDPVLRILTKFVTCHSCQVPYSVSTCPPQLLPCNHTFCKKCVLTIEEQECPTCQAEYVPNEEIPDDGRVQVLQTLLAELKGKSNNASEEEASEESLCDFCNENEVQFRCKECQADMCEDCKQNRHIGKTFKRHHVAEVKNNGQKGDKNERPETCNETGHEKKQLELFCYGEDCRHLICSACSEDHSASPHKVVNLEMALKRLKNDIHDVASRFQAEDTTEDRQDMYEVLKLLQDSGDRMFVLYYGPACLSVAEDLDSEVSPDDLENILLSAIPGEEDEDEPDSPKTKEEPSTDEDDGNDVEETEDAQAEKKNESKKKNAEKNGVLKNWSVLRWIVIGGAVAVMFHFSQRIMGTFFN